MRHRVVRVVRVVRAVRAVRAVRVVRVGTVGIAVLATLSGCASGGTVTHPIMTQSPVEILVPSPASSIAARIEESSDSVLKARLLTLSDLPTGWQRSDNSDDNDSDGSDSGDGSADSSDNGLSSAAGCKAVSDPAYTVLPLHAQADFTSGSSLPKLTETLAYGSTSEVDAAWTGYVQDIATCSHVTVQLAGQSRELTITQLALPQTKQATVARQAVTTKGRTASVCLIVFRKGNLLTALTYSAWGPPDASEVRHLVETADSATSDIR